MKKRFKPIEERPSGVDVLVLALAVLVLLLGIGVLTGCGGTVPAGSPDPLDSPVHGGRTEWHPESSGHFGPFGNGFNNYAP